MEAIAAVASFVHITLVSSGSRKETMTTPNDITENSVAKLCSSSASPKDMANELRKSGWWQKGLAFGFHHRDNGSMAQFKHIEL